jgi:hypothetical protein
MEVLAVTAWTSHVWSALQTPLPDVLASLALGHVVLAAVAYGVVSLAFSPLIRRLHDAAPARRARAFRERHPDLDCGCDGVEFWCPAHLRAKERVERGLPPSPPPGRVRVPGIDLSKVVPAVREQLESRE